jgi:hypothetical protein
VLNVVRHKDLQPDLALAAPTLSKIRNFEVREDHQFVPVYNQSRDLM